MNTEFKIIFIVGPTATGKSQLALRLAQKYNGSIINIDSVQFYNGLYVGAAAPSEQEKKLVPHYLYSYINAPHVMTAGQYIRDFYELLKTKNVASPIFVVGGTGFYIQALEKGMYDLPEVPLDIKNQVINDFENLGDEKMFAELKDFDVHTDLHQNDHYRIGRALEVKRAFNLKMSEFKKLTALNNKNKLPFPAIKIGLTFDTTEKVSFAERVHQRSLMMIEQGIITEVKNFLQDGFEDWAPLSSVGYLETKNYLQGKIKKEDLAQEITRSTMKLVKKQKTWFKRDNTILWSNAFNPDLDYIDRQVQDFLAINFDASR